MIKLLFCERSDMFIEMDERNIFLIFVRAFASRKVIMFSSAGLLWNIL